MSGSETRLIARHAGTVLAGQLAVMAYSVADTIVAGRYAENALAALSVAAAIFITVFVSLMGTLQALLPVWAELHGARRHAEVGHSVRQSLYLCGATIVIGMAILLWPGPLLRWTEVPPAMRDGVEGYLAVLAFALPPALLFRLFTTLSQSLGKPQVVTVLQLGSLLVKVPLSIWFTFGGGGLPALGLVGCGFATLLVNWGLLACAVWLLRMEPFYRECRIWQRMEPPDWHALGQFLRLGVPTGLAVLVEVTSFTLLALFIARLGTAASAAHQIASNLTAVFYMVPLSLAISTSARVSFWQGAGDTVRARRAGRRGLELTLGCALIFALALLLLRRQLPAIYSDNPQVIAVAAVLLLPIAAFHLADAVQVLCLFVLRCYRVTVAPLLIYCGFLWGVGLFGGYLLAYRGLGPWLAMQSPLAFWLMSTLALWLSAACLAALLQRTVRRAG